MTRLKARFKLDASAYNIIEREAIRRGKMRISDTEPMDKVAKVMQKELNNYERYLMGKRAADPIQGGINTAQWSSRFEIFMFRGDSMYGRFVVTNRQKPYTYHYTGYNKSFTVGRGARKKTYGAKPWVASGQIGNLAAVRYAVPETNHYMASYVFPKKGKSIMFYSHVHGGLIFRRYRQYSSGGHERYHVHIDNIIMDNIAKLGDEIVSYAPKSISLLTPKK